MESDEKIVDEKQLLRKELEVSEDVESICDRVPHRYHSKATQILEACRWKDVQSLRDLAVSEAGLLSDEIRRQACQYPLEYLRIVLIVLK